MKFKFSVIYVCPHTGQGLVLVFGFFFSEISCLCKKADLRLYWPRKGENSLLCAFPVIFAIKINHYTILVHSLKKKKLNLKCTKPMKQKKQN